MKFGHEIIVETNVLNEPAVFIAENDTEYCIILNNMDWPKTFPKDATEIKLNPDATTFLPGDEVEVRDTGNQEWETGIYAGYDTADSNFAHYVEYRGISVGYKYCRYPQSNRQEKLEQTIETIKQVLSKL